MLTRGNLEYITQEQEEFIIKHYFDMSSGQISREIGCSIDKVCNTWYKHGLHGKQKRVYRIEREDYFENIDTPTKAYFLGFIASDGCIYKPNDTRQGIVRIGIQRRDESILETFRCELGYDRPISRSHGKYSAIEVSSDKMCSDLNKLGLAPHKTYGNTIPSIDDAMMKYFARGYFDGDGCIHTGKLLSDCTISISGYEFNLKKILEYLESRNIFGGFYPDKRDYAPGAGRFGLLQFCNVVAKYGFLKHIYEDVSCPYLPRKREKALSFINQVDLSDNAMHRITKIFYTHAVQSAS